MVVFRAIQGNRWILGAGLAALLLALAGCGSAPRTVPVETPPPAQTAPVASATQPVPDLAELLALDKAPLPETRAQTRSRWQPVRWRELPGLGADSLDQAWNAWLRSCQRPGPVFAPLCAQVRQLSIAEPEARLRWMIETLQPYRVLPLDDGASADGLLTSYFEPLLPARRQAAPGFQVPLYRPPAGLPGRGARPWFSRKEIETLPQARAALAGREIAWLADPVDALILHIQGSGQLDVTEADGSSHRVRLAFAGTNEQPYRSVGRWLIDQGQLRDASWPGIKDWIASHPQRLQELMWTNPRYVFFREEAPAELDADAGPRGAQGVPLTAGRSIAVDPTSIPFGTPVWLASSGVTAQLQRLVFAQDTGSAIVGAVRADFYAGAGDQAGELAQAALAAVGAVAALKLYIQ